MASPHAARRAGVEVNQDKQEWEQRVERRTYAVSLMKNTDLYRLASMVAAIEGDDGAPRTPDPRDRSTSKRVWEAKVWKWKADMHTFCEDHGYKQRRVDAEQ